MQKNPTTISVVAAALIAPDGRVLLHRRPFDKQHGGLWEFPGGKVEPGEAASAALARELLEELGIEIAPGWFDYIASAVDSDAKVQIDLFACHNWVGEPQCLEGEAIGWFVIEAVFDLPMPPLDLPLAKALKKAI